MTAERFTHKKHGRAKCIASTVVLAMCTLVAVYIFVYLQYAYVRNGILLCLTVMALIATSFWSSAMEAAFSTIRDARNSFAGTVNKKLDASFEEYSKFRDSISNFAEVEQDDARQMKRMIRKKDRLKNLHRLASGVDRAEIVGAFATLSVMLNLSVGVFIPLALHDKIGQLLVIGPIGELPLLGRMTGPAFDRPLDATTKTMFVFTLSTIPVLIFGKIIPKMLGLSRPAWWIEKFYAAAYLVKRSFGWISVGATWFLDRAEAKAEDRGQA